MCARPCNSLRRTTALPLGPAVCQACDRHEGAGTQHKDLPLGRSCSREGDQRFAITRRNVGAGGDKRTEN